jgi:hypothetical protein
VYGPLVDPPFLPPEAMAFIAAKTWPSSWT